MDKDFSEFLEFINSDQARETQAELMRETLARYCDDGASLPDERLPEAVLNAARDASIALLGAYHAWFSGEER